MAEAFPTTPRAPTVVRLSAIVIGLIGVALATRCTITSTRWVGRTFPGFLLLDNRIIASIGLAHWNGRGDLYQQQVMAVDGHPVSSAVEAYSHVEELPPDTPIHYLLRSPRGVEREVTVRSQRFELFDWVFLFGAYLMNSAVYLASGLVVLGASPARAARARTARVRHHGRALDADGAGPLRTRRLLPSSRRRRGVLPRCDRASGAVLPGHALARTLRVGGLRALARAARPVPAPALPARPVRPDPQSVHALPGNRGGPVRRSHRPRIPRRALAAGASAHPRGDARHARRLRGPRCDLPGLGAQRWRSGGQHRGLHRIPLRARARVRRREARPLRDRRDGEARRVLPPADGRGRRRLRVSIVLFNLGAAPAPSRDSAAFPLLFTLAVLVLFNPLRTFLQGVVDRVFFRTRYDGAQGARGGRRRAGARRSRAIRSRVWCATASRARFPTRARGSSWAVRTRACEEVGGGRHACRGSLFRFADARARAHRVRPGGSVPRCGDRRARSATRSALSSAEVAVPLWRGGELVGVADRRAEALGALLHRRRRRLPARARAPGGDRARRTPPRTRS